MYLLKQVPLTKENHFPPLILTCAKVCLQIHGDVCSHLAPSNINNSKQTVILQDAVAFLHGCGMVDFVIGHVYLTENNV